MYPTLTEFLRQIFGVTIPLPIQTYGLFVAIAYLSASYILMLELKRKEKEGIMQIIRKKVLVGEGLKPLSVILSIFTGFLLGYKILEMVLSYSAFVENPQTFILSSRGSFIGGILGAGLSFYMTWYENKKQRLPQPKWIEKEIHPYQTAGNILIISAISGLLGAKLFHNLENFEELLRNPIESIFSFSGLTFYGGLVCGAAACIYFARKNNMPILSFIDANAPGLSLAYSFGRMGCHLSGDGCWGIVNTAPKPSWMSFLPDSFWSNTFPHNVVNEGVKMADCAGNHCYILDKPVFPTSLYESLFLLLVFAILMLIRKKITTPGVIFSIYLLLAGTERFIVEHFRVNNVYHIFGNSITQAEIISSVSILLGVSGLIWLVWYPKIKKSSKAIQEK